MKRSSTIRTNKRYPILLSFVLLLPQFVNGQQWKVYNEQNSNMPENTLGTNNELSVDGEGNLWIIHQERGVVKFSQNNDEWTYYHAENSPLPDNDNLSGILTEDGFVWAANYSAVSNGVYEFDGSTWRALTSDDGGNYLLRDKNKDLWFAKRFLFGPSLHKYDYSDDSITDKSSSLPIPPPFTSVLSEMAIDSEGKIWMAQITSVGPDKSVLFVIDEAITYDENDCDIFNHTILEIEIAPNDDLWLGTVTVGSQAGGVACLKKETGEWVTYHTGNSPLPDNLILDMKSDAQNRLWFGTYHGLAMFDGSDWKVYNTENSPLPSDTVNAVTIDSFGAKWIATPKGLARFNEISADYEFTDCSLYVSFTDQSQTSPGSITAWQWDFGGLGASDEQNPDFAFPQAGVYSVTLQVTDDSGNRENITKEITVGDPVNLLSLGPDVDSCNPSVVLSSNVSGAASYEWTLPTGEIVDGESMLTATQNGTYALSVTTHEGCTYSNAVNVILNRFTTTDITLSVSNSTVEISDSIYTGTSVTLTAGPGEVFAWDFGNGVTAAANPVTLAYSQPGTYVVTLSAGMDDRECPVTAEKIIVVNDIFIANAMTPNGDGKNDVLIIEPMLDNAFLKVLNRWGQVVYASDLHEENFDGKGLESGIYFYELSFRNFNNVYKGNFHIIK